MRGGVVKTIWILIFLIVAFGVVGRIDYEAALADANNRIEAQTLAARSHSEGER